MPSTDLINKINLKRKGLYFAETQHRAISFSAVLVRCRLNGSFGRHYGTLAKAGGQKEPIRRSEKMKKVEQNVRKQFV